MQLPDVLEPRPENQAKVEQSRRSGVAITAEPIKFEVPFSPPPRPIDGAALMTDIYNFIRRFVYLSESQAVVVTLWIVHTHCIDAAEVTPYLAINSAERESGKTRLLEVLKTLAAKPWFTGRVTAAVLVRKIDKDRPTLLLDESDAAFSGEKDYAEALRGVLNTGHGLDGVASLCVGKGSEITFKDFSTFCPKAIAGIGKLPDTVASRAIPIRLKRASRLETVERFYRRKTPVEAAPLRDRLEIWASQIMDRVRSAFPSLPDALSDRQQDGAEPLLAIADVAGNGWPKIARAAIVDLCARDSSDDDGSTGVRLLADIRAVFHEERLSSRDLVELLTADESSRWREHRSEKPLSSPQLATLLRRYDIHPKQIWTGEKNLRGYVKQDFEDAWSRYLPAIPLAEAPKC